MSSNLFLEEKMKINTNISEYLPLYCMYCFGNDTKYALFIGHKNKQTREEL